MKKNKKITDMTSGNIVYLIFMFALPIFLGNVLQQLYNVIDTVIAGYNLGDDALAAIGTTGAVYSLIVGMANGMNGGYSIVAARSFGAKDIKQLRNSIALMIILNLAISAVLSALSVVTIKPMLSLLNTPDAIMNDAYKYIIIILSGMIFTNLYNMESGILRALGNSRTSLILLAVSLFMNIVLDLLFIIVLKIGVMGLALATVLSQMISVILCYINRIKSYPQLRISKEDFKFKKDFFKDMFETGLSMGLVNSIFAIGSVALQGSINSMGKATITAHLAARKIDEMLMLPLVTFASSSATFIGQNYGAKKKQRIKEGIIKTCMMGFIWSAFVTICIFAMAPILVKMITGTTEVYIIDTAVKYLKINIPFFFVLAILFVIRVSLQAIGNKVVPIVSSVIELVGKCFVAAFLTAKIGYLGVCITEPSLWIICTIFLVKAFIRDYREFLSEKDEPVLIEKNV